MLHLIPLLIPNDAGCYLLKQLLPALPKAPKAFHREGGKFDKTIVEGHLSSSSVVRAFARLASGGG